MAIRYQFMKKEDVTEVCALIENVFNEFLAPEYGAEGTSEFFKFAQPAALLGRMGPEQVVVVAKQGAKIVGFIEINKLDHISMLFVSLREQGIGKELYRTATKECLQRKPGLKQVTVNASLYAEPVYHRLGFKATGPRQEKNGIIFVPMVHELK